MSGVVVLAAVRKHHRVRRELPLNPHPLTVSRLRHGLTVAGETERHAVAPSKVPRIEAALTRPSVRISEAPSDEIDADRLVLRDLERRGAAQTIAAQQGHGIHASIVCQLQWMEVRR